MPQIKMPCDPDRDLRISARFAELRQLRCLSQSRFAKAIGLTLAQLSNIERGRSPLRYIHATRALGADAFAAERWPGIPPFNPLWLSGLADWPIAATWPILLPDPVSIGLDLTLRFSDFVNTNMAMLQSFASETPENARLPESWLEPYTIHWRQYHGLASLAASADSTLLAIIGPSAAKLSPTSPTAQRVLQTLKNRAQGMEWIDHLNQKESSKQVLHNDSDNVILLPMKCELSELLGTVRRLTEPRGMKSKLAKDLDVPLPRVSDWLAGNYMPSGDRALRLREWVCAQETQQNKSPGSVSPPPGPKTQSGRSNENESKSSPP